MNYNAEAVNDIYIYDLLKSGQFKVINGELYTNRGLRKAGLKTGPWRKCGSTNSDGYKILNTRMFGNQKTIYIHRIVYAHYNKYLNAYKTINHINKIRSDNRIENLEEVTWFENLSLSKRSRIK